MKKYSTTSAATLEAECCPSAVSPTSPASSSPPMPPPSVILSPCAACKTLRRRCAERCMLAPYFPPNEPLKFVVAHRVFGAGNIIKFLQEIREDQREDAVNSMVYEANARLRDPIYGCAGAISCLQKQINELQVELSRAHAQISNMQCQNANLLDEFCKRMATEDAPKNVPPIDDHQCHENSTTFFEDGVMGESLWTWTMKERFHEININKVTN